MMGVMRARPAIAAVPGSMVWVASAAAAISQQPDSRLIDTEPKVLIRPPGSELPHADPDRRVAEPREDRGTERDRGLDLELDRSERRGLMDGGSTGRSWVAAAVFVAAGGLLLLLVTWAIRRRDR